MLGFTPSKIGSRICWVDPTSLEFIKPESEAIRPSLRGVTGGTLNEVSYGSRASCILKSNIEGHLIPKIEHPELMKKNATPVSKSAPNQCLTVSRRPRGRPRKHKKAIYVCKRSEKSEAWVPSDDDSDFNPHESDHNCKRSKKGDSLKCFVCRKAFIPTTLKFHVHKCHKDFSKNRCFVCGKAFCSPQVVQKHMQTSHFGVHNYKCPDCGKGYYYYMKLHSHMRRVHNYELPPSRRQCHIRSGNRQPISRPPSFKLDEHEEVQDQELRETDCRCPVCREVFLVDFLPGHMKDNHKNFSAEQCYFCDASFASAELTQQHIQFNHLKPALYTCHECSKMFADLSEFRDHMLQIHQTDTMYKCDHCERVFVLRKYLRQHIRQEHSSGGAVFSMRDNFHSERTSLTEVCDKQQQGLIDFLALIDSNSQEEETKAPESSVEQESPASIAKMDCNVEAEVQSEEPNQQQQEEPKDPTIIVKQDPPI